MSGKNRKPAKHLPDSPQPEINAFRSQHLALAQRQIATELGAASVLIDEGESPLAWLAAGAAAMAAAISKLTSCRRASDCAPISHAPI